jgi:ketosteroid isomerase-like protein
MYVEFETDQKTRDGSSLHTEVVGVSRLRRGKVVFYREYLFDPDETEAIWGIPDTREAA